MLNFRRILFLVVLLPTSSILACSMSIGGASKPTAEILTPPSGTQVPLGEQVQVEYRASDAVAVVRVELEVDEQIVDSQNSPVREGQPSMTGVLRWTPTTPGTRIVIVYAYNRDRIVSDAVAVEIIVEQSPAPEPSATPATQFTPTAAVVATPTVPNWPVALADDFDDPDSGFGEDGYGDSRRFYQDGRYNIEILPENAVTWTSRGSFSDFVLELDVVSHGEVGGAGVIFRNQEDQRQFYLFAINVDGQYWLRMMTPTGWKLILDWRESPHVRTGPVTNRLRAVCVGSEISLYVNGQYLDTVQDTTYSQGEIGMLGGTWHGETNALFSFDNLRVYASVPLPQPTATPTAVPPSPTPVPPTPTSGPSKFDPIIFAQGVTPEEGNCIMPGTTFSAGTKIVYAVWACRGMYPGLEMVNKWYLNGQEYASSTVSWDRADERGRWWVSLSRQSGAPLPSGAYQLELYVEGRILQSGTLVIH